MTAVSRRAFLLGTSLALALPLSACAPPQPRRLAMAGGEAGGMYFRFGRLLRGALRRRGAAELTVQQTGGSGENVGLLADGSVDLAIALADTVADDPRGLVAIGRVYQNYLHCVMRADDPVPSLDDLAHRRISVGAPGSGASVTARILLDGLADRAGGVDARELTLTGAAAALKDRSIDAFFWSGGIPTPQIGELAAELPVSLLDLSAALPILNAAHPGTYVAATVPSGVYGVSRPTETVGIPNLLLARPDLDSDTVAALVDTLVEDTRQLVPTGSVGIQFLTASNLIDTSPVPLHPAAERRYRERYG